MEENKGVVERGGEEILDAPGIIGDGIVELAEKAEKRIEGVNKIKQLALRVTNSHDWVDQQGKPSLQVSGSEKVARLFGISWAIDEPTYQQEEDGHFAYTYKGYFSVGNATIEAIGTRSSKDKFFSVRYKWNEEKKKKEPFDVPPSEIDKGDLKKGAYTNCIGNGITRLLGIRNLTYDDLKSASLDISKIAKVDYGTAPEMSSESKDIKVETHKMLVALFGENYGAELAKITAFTGKDGKPVSGVQTLDVSEKRLQVIYGKVKELFEKKPQSPAGNGSPPQGTEPKDEIIRKDLLAKINVAKKEVGDTEYTRTCKARKVESLDLCDNGELENLLDDLRSLWMARKK